MPQYSSKDGGLSVKQLPNGWLRAVLRWGTKGKVVSLSKNQPLFMGQKWFRHMAKPIWKHVQAGSTPAWSTNEC